MKRKTILFTLIAAGFVAGGFLLRHATVAQQTFRLSVGSDGSDGAFHAPTSILIDLSEAVTASWDTPSPEPGKGVYDPEKWAVVFKFTSMTVDAPATVTFRNHPSGAPVVFLVEDDVLINGWIDVRGESAFTASRFRSNPGPGGFGGGFGHDVGSVIRSGGFGPGGGARVTPNNSGGGASHAGQGAGEPPSLPYGNVSALQLLGGSGGGGGRANRDDLLIPGGAGGGAILIAAGGTIVLNSGGQIMADGGGSNFATGGGSGGVVRLIAQRVEGNGRIHARGGTAANQAGGVGYTRIEAFESTLGQGTPPYSFHLTDDPPQIWPPVSAPRIAVTRIFSDNDGELTVPADPWARLDGVANTDVALDSEGPVTAEISAENVPLDWLVRVRVVPRLEDDFVVTAVFVSGDATASVWHAAFTPPPGVTSVIARADAPSP